MTNVSDLAGWLIGELAGGDGPPWVVGHSLGGAVALAAAVERPELFAGLILVNSSARLKVHPAILTQAEAAAAGGATVDLSLAFARPDRAGDYLAQAAQTPPASALADWHACNGFDVRERLGGLQVTTLVIYGSKDLLTPPKHQTFLVEAVPSATAREVSGAGHMVPWEASSEFWSAVTDFVET